MATVDERYAELRRITEPRPDGSGPISRDEVSARWDALHELLSDDAMRAKYKAESMAMSRSVRPDMTEEQHEADWGFAMMQLGYDAD